MSHASTGRTIDFQLGDQPTETMRPGDVLEIDHASITMDGGAQVRSVTVTSEPQGGLVAEMLTNEQVDEVVHGEQLVPFKTVVKARHNCTGKVVITWSRTIEAGAAEITTVAITVSDETDKADAS